jgi:small redox-active disulfide protein 2
MTKEDVVQIKVEDYAVGIIGLNTALQDMATAYAEKSDQEVADALVNRLSKKNYIPNKAREPYKKAFLREFKKHVGRPYEEVISSCLDIKVLGPGCPQCDGLEEALMAAVGQLRIKANIEHVRDINEIGRYGVMGSPGLLINGKVKSVGKVPPGAKLVQWLEEANAKQEQVIRKKK